MYYTYKSWVLYRTIAGHYTYDYSVAARFIRTSQKSKFIKQKQKLCADTKLYQSHLCHGSQEFDRPLMNSDAEGQMVGV